ncbi:MAG: hypothetical protein ACJA2S_004287, partial [Cyclobacteriaceae bacterium]
YCLPIPIFLKLKQYSKISLGVNSRVRGLQYAYVTLLISNAWLRNVGEFEVLPFRFTH